MADVDNIPKTIEILLHCFEECENTIDQLSPSISMVPRRLRDLSPMSFNPKLVSIGPLHCKNEKMQAFEGQKATYAQALLQRLTLEFDVQPEETLRECVQKVNGSISEIRECYIGMKPYSDVELAKIMVMDACFILEFLLTFPFMNALLRGSINSDLLLVENQIPFFVLEYIFECTILKLDPTTSLTNIILPILKRVNCFELELRVDADEDATHDHILGILHKCYSPTKAITSDDDDDGMLPTFHSVVELERAGVNFKPNKDSEWPLAMEVQWYSLACLPWFRVKPTLKMPPLSIDDHTESFLRNLIAYEQSSSAIPNYVTSYAAAMDLLINTPTDIAHLAKSKAIINIIGSNEEAASMINSVCKEAAFTDFFYTKEWKQLDSYYSHWWPKSIAGLKRKYFNSPWNLIALLAGIMLFVLTVLQTIYAIKT